MTVQESKVKSFIMLGNIPFSDSDRLVNNDYNYENPTQFIMNTRIKYEIARAELHFNNQTQAFQYIQGSTPDILELDIGSLNFLIHLIKFGENKETSLTFTSGPNGLSSQKWGSFKKNTPQLIFNFDNGNSYIIEGPGQIKLLTTQLEIALDMLSKGAIEYSVKREYIPGKMSGVSIPPAAGTPTNVPQTEIINNMNTAPEGVNVPRPNFGPEINKAPGNPTEVVPAIPGQPYISNKI
jgi:hypothetical protein